jgi:hypothetical protein
MPGINPQRETERVRWYILTTIEAGRPDPVREKLILHTLADSDLVVTAAIIRRELAYLEERVLVHITGRDTTDGWSATLTNTGVDLVEYTIPCNPGIARPPRD